MLLTIAIPKGRILKQLAQRLAITGISTEVLNEGSRALIRKDPQHNVQFLLLKPDDVPTYVEYGVADLGIVGRDTLLERDYDLYIPADLGIGQCRMVIAGLPQAPLSSFPPGYTLRVATKFNRSAEEYFRTLGIPHETIYVQSSVELAPLTGLADVIVDLVESGQTLKDNGLVEFETLHTISSVIIANRVGYKLKHQKIKPFLDRLQQG